MERLTIAEVRNLFEHATLDESQRLVERFSSDERLGVQRVLDSVRRDLARQEAEDARLYALGEMERSLLKDGRVAVAGVDEVGRGALAGPVTAAAVILPPETRIDQLNDSKRLKPDLRESIAKEIRRQARAVAICHVCATEIDQKGIALATLEAMRRSLGDLDIDPDHVLVDGLPVELGYASTAVVKGDSVVAAIAAASIVAKVERDALMRSYEDEYPGYGFKINKGYGTAEHITAINEQGPSKIHRRSFSPCGGTLSLF